jgi:hypothetical protein
MMHPAPVEPFQYQYEWAADLESGHQASPLCDGATSRRLTQIQDQAMLLPQKAVAALAESLLGEV